MRTGLKIGYVDDIEMDTQGANIVSLIVYGKPRAFGIMGRDEDIIIKMLGYRAYRRRYHTCKIQR
mgnify:CR=1 FL=1